MKQLKKILLLSMTMITMTTIVPSYAIQSEQQEKQSEIDKLLETKKSLEEKISLIEHDKHKFLTDVDKTKHKIEQIEKIDETIEKQSVKTIGLTNQIVFDSKKTSFAKEELEKEQKKRITSEIKAEILSEEVAQDINQKIINTINATEDIKSEIADLQSKIEKIERGVSDKTIELTKSAQFHFPAQGVYTSMYGWREHWKEPGQREWHTGVDIAGSGAIKSALKGKVITAREISYGAGRYVVIEHGEIDGVRLRTLYAHLDSYSVKEGDVVEKGQVIGQMGTTGWSTGVHLHFEVHENEQQVNPKPYLDKATAY